jgi:hypothetical protein
MSVGGLASTIALLLPRFADVWDVDPRDGEAVGDVWEKAIQSVPEGQRPAGVIKTIERLPWINAIATTAVVFFPRFAYTFKFMRRPRPEEMRQGDWKAKAPPPAPPPGSAAAGGNGATSPPIVADDTHIPSAYDDKRIDMDAIDGTASRAASE